MIRSVIALETPPTVKRDQLGCQGYSIFWSDSAKQKEENWRDNAIETKIGWQWPRKMVSAFISHSSKDKAFVRELADFLMRGNEIEVFLDERSIGFGDDIVAKIQSGLNHDVVLLILSPDSVQSKWVQQEYGDAFWEQTNTSRTKLLPVLYRDCAIPHLIKNKKHFDLRKNH